MIFFKQILEYCTILKNGESNITDFFCLSCAFWLITGSYAMIKDGKDKARFGSAAERICGHDKGSSIERALHCSRITPSLSKAGWTWYSHDGLFLCARTEVSLDLGLVDPVQSQHQEDSTHAKRPEGVTLQRVWVQATRSKYISVMIKKRNTACKCNGCILILW